VQGDYWLKVVGKLFLHAAGDLPAEGKNNEDFNCDHMVFTREINLLWCRG